MSGHPDWQGYAEWVGTPLIDQIGIAATPGGTLFGPFAVTHFSALVVGALPHLGICQVAITYRPSTTLSGVGLLQTLVWNNNAQGVYIVPCLTGTIQSILVQGLAANASLDLFVAPANLAPNSLADADNAFPLQVLAGGLAAGANRTLLLAPYYGAAMLHFKATTGTYTLQLNASDVFGIESRYLELAGVAGVADQFVYLAPWGNSLLLTNTSAVAGVFDAVVTRAPAGMAR